MADQETQNELPVDSASTTSSSSTLDVLKSYALKLGKNAFEAANAIPAPKAPDQATITLPQLTESVQTGYKYDKATKKITSSIISCCTLQNHLVEKNTAYDFLLMSNAAAKDGVSLKISSGFRTMEQQKALYEERKNHAVAKEKGVAAFPGTSNHQSGIAIDIDVKMHISDYLRGSFSPEYLWLEKYGKEFGFDHAEGAGVNEPWHWTHLVQKIVGSTAFQSATGLAVLTVDTAVDAAASNQSGVLRLTNLIGHDETVVMARATSFSQATRQTMMTERSISSGYASSYLSSRASQLEASKLTLEEEPKAFVQATINALVYDFKTGTWGDKKPV
jgi:hypothetical protein